MAQTYRYYMPHADWEFLEWMLNFLEVAFANAAVWLLPLADLNALKALAQDFKVKLEQCSLDSVTKADIRDKNAAHYAAQAAFRDFVNAHVRYNQVIRDSDRAALGTHVPDHVRSNIGVPHEYVRLEVSPTHTFQHHIRCSVEETGSHAIPYGYNGVELRWRILEHGDPVPLDLETDYESALLTKSPHIQTFRHTDRGKRVAYTAAWQNEKGQNGPFCTIQVHIIP